jgi:hypothetical protein
MLNIVMLGTVTKIEVMLSLVMTRASIVVYSNVKSSNDDSGDVETGNEEHSYVEPSNDDSVMFHY